MTRRLGLVSVWARALLLAFVAGLLPSTWAATAEGAGLQAVPALRAHVVDETGTLAAADVQQLTQQLAEFERKHGAQLAVLLVASTAPEDIADYSQRVAEAWKLGRAGVGDGVLLVVALQDRRVRIAPYKALEGAVPDVVAKRIINEHIVPAFRRGDHAGGLRAALVQLQELISAEALPSPPTAAPDLTAAQWGASHSNPGAAAGIDWEQALVLLLLAVPFARALVHMLGRRWGALASAGAAGALVWQFSQHGAWALGAAVLGFVVALLAPALSGAWGALTGPNLRHRGGRGGHFGGYSGADWGSGGGGGGGFASGGGGDAGGGGASGSW